MGGHPAARTLSPILRYSRRTPERTICDAPAVSSSQTTTLPLSTVRTFRRPCGFAQRTSINSPSISMDAFGSNCPAKLWCADENTAKTNMKTAAQKTCRVARMFMAPYSLTLLLLDSAHAQPVCEEFCPFGKRGIVIRQADAVRTFLEDVHF